MICCATVDVIPTTRDAATRAQAVGARAASASATASKPNCTMMKSSPIHHVAQRHEEKQPGGIADLGGRRD